MLIYIFESFKPLLEDRRSWTKSLFFQKLIMKLGSWTTLEVRKDNVYLEYFWTNRSVVNITVRICACTYSICDLTLNAVHIYYNDYLRLSRFDTLCSAKVTVDVQLQLEVCRCFYVQANTCAAQQKLRVFCVHPFAPTNVVKAWENSKYDVIMNQITTRCIYCKHLRTQKHNG